MNTNQIWICLSLFFGFASAWMELVPDNEVVDCTPDGANQFMDFSRLEFPMESDEDFFFNGTIKYLKTINAPWKVKCLGERWIRDQWVPGVEKKVDDYCDFMKNKMNPMYSLFKDQKACPLQPGDFWTWNMSKIALDSFAYVPPHFAGKWRILIKSYFQDNGIPKEGCIQVSGYLFEANKARPRLN